MRLSALRLAMLSAGFGLAMPVVAAESGVAMASLEDVVVTATKREEKLKDVAMSITAVSGDDLSRRVDNGLADLSTQIPGLAVQAADATSPRIILRGQNVGSVGATVATTIDDIPMFMSGAQSDGAYFGSNIDSYDLSRIEVLRGPQGTLYGAAAEAGLIKYVTNKPVLGKFEGEAQVGFVSTTGGSSNATFKGLVNVPMGNIAALRVSAVSDDSPGWVDNELTGQKNINAAKRQSMRASLLVKPTDALTLRATYMYQDIKADGGNSVEVVGAALTPQSPPVNQFDQVNGFQFGTLWPNKVDYKVQYSALAVEYDMGAAILTSATSDGKITNYFQSDISNQNLMPGLTYGQFFGLYVYGVPSVVAAGHQTDFVKKFNQEVRLSSKPGSTLFGKGFDWQVGAFYTHEETGLIQPYDARSVTDVSQVLSPPVGGAQIPADYKETSAFVDFTYHFTKRFDVELGGRTTRVKQQSQVKLECCVLYGPSFDFDPIHSTESSQTWSFAPRFHLSDDTLLYARIATGFRPGGPNLPTPTLPDPPNFLPDSTRNYEVGLRTDLFNKQVSVDVAVFNVDWKDIQILSIVNTPSGPVGINGNSGTARSRGVEWNLAWHLSPSLTMSWLGAYTDAKLTADAPGLGAYSGDELPYVPDIQTTFNLDSRHALAGGGMMFAGASWSYVGTRFTGFSPSVSVVEPHVSLPSYSTLNAQVGVDYGRWSVELYGHNLGNEKGIADFGSQGAVNQRGIAAFIQPRTVGVQVGVKF
jgi:outer membrane receptor protein involved in Fe transport